MVVCRLKPESTYALMAASGSWPNCTAVVSEKLLSAPASPRSPSAAWSAVQKHVFFLGNSVLISGIAKMTTSPVSEVWRQAMCV